MTSARRWVLACVLLGLALRVAFALLYWVNQPLTHDEREYLALARSVARGEGFQYPADEPSPGTAQQFGRAPGYPAFLAAIIIPAPVNHTPRRIKIAQAVLGAVSIWLIAAIAGRAAGPRAAVTAAAIAAVYPPLVWMPAYVLSETLFSVLALAAARVLQELGAPAAHPVPPASHLAPPASRLAPPASRLAPPASRLAPSASAAERLRRDLAIARLSFPASVGGLTSLLAGAVLTGLAILTRPAMLFFLPFAALWLWRKRRLADALLFLVLAAVCVAPWTIRNHRVYGRWIAVASEGGVTFWTGNHPLAVGDGDLAANPAIKRAELEFRAARPGVSAEALEPLYYRDAFAWIRSDPGAWLRLLARKAFYTVVPAGPSYAVHSTKYVAASVAAYLLVLPAAIAGAWRWRTFAWRSPAPVPLWLMVAATVTAGLVFFPQERFRIPVIDPALIVSAALLACEARTDKDERTRRHANV